MEESPAQGSSASLDRGAGTDSTDECVANPGWGAPRIHGELGKLGIQVSETTVAKYMMRHPNPPFQTWRTFLTNHIKDLVSADCFVVPTATFRLLFVFVTLSHDRRRRVHFAVTRYPTAEWTAQQLLQAFPWMRLRVFCCATATAITAKYFAKRPPCWASRKRCVLRPHPGRMPTQNG